jgi:hypothetical protein
MNLPPTSPRSAAAILADILAIENPIRGSLTITHRPSKNGTTKTHYHLQKSVNGKNVTTYIPPEKAEEVQKGIEQHKKLRALMDELDASGLQTALHGQTNADDVKKKAQVLLLCQTFSLHIAQTLTNALDTMTREGLGPVTNLENQLHDQAKELCRQAMELVLNDPAVPVPGDAPQEGEVYAGTHEREVVSLFGMIRLRLRKYFYQPLNKRDNPKNPNCKKHRKHRRKKGQKAGRFPVDDALRLIGGCTPALAMRALEYAAEHPYDKAARLFGQAYTDALTPDLLKALTRTVSPKAWEFLCHSVREAARDVECAVILADGTGMPMRPEELYGVKGRGPSGEAKTHEAKIGAFFEMKPVPGDRAASERLPDSTTYVASLERKDGFSPLLRGESLRLWPRPPKILLFIADGSPWLWDIRRACFPKAVEILDFFHASEHLKPLLELAGHEGEAWTKTRELWKEWLLEGRVDKLIQTCEALAAGATPEKAKLWDKALHYYRENKGRMKYNEYTAAGWFIGSGVVESACKQLVGNRFKQPGMRWSRAGADAVLPLRTLLMSGRYEKFWDFMEKNGKNKAAA